MTDYEKVGAAFSVTSSGPGPGLFGRMNDGQSWVGARIPADGRVTSVWHCGVCGHTAEFQLGPGDRIGFEDPRFCEHGPKAPTYPDGTLVYGEHTASALFGHYFPGDATECMRGCGLTLEQLQGRMFPR